MNSPQQNTAAARSATGVPKGTWQAGIRRNSYPEWARPYKALPDGSTEAASHRPAWQQKMGDEMSKVKALYEFTTNLDLGAMGRQKVSIDYTHDGDMCSLMSVWIMDGKDIVLDITEFLSNDGEEQVDALIAYDLPIQLQEAAEYAADCDREAYQDAMRSQA